MNKETLEIFGQYLNGGRKIIMSKARQTGRSDITVSIMAWKHLHHKYERRLLRKETIKRIFNI